MTSNTAPRLVSAHDSVLRTLLWGCGLAVAVLAVGFAGVAVASPADQSVAYQLGPTHDGHMINAALATPLTQQWSVTLPGASSYPLIVNGMVFVTAADGKLYALNQATGSIIWSRALGGESAPEGLAYDRGQVFAVSFDGDLTAFDPSTGSINWTAHPPGEYFVTASPTAADGIVYMAGAGSGLSAIRESDGRRLWSQRVSGEGSSPAVDGQAVFVTYACQGAFAFARTSGDPLWGRQALCSGGGGRTPVVADGTVFARDSAGYDNLMLSASTGAQLGTFSAGPAPAIGGGVAFMLSDSTLRALTRSGQGATAWQFTGDGSLENASLVVGSVMFVSSSAGQLYALDAATGSVRWSTNVGSAVPHDDMGAANGTLVVPAGNRLVAYRTAGAITTAPVDQAPPTIDGKAQVGQILAADVGIWAGLPNSYAYQWQRCGATGGSCVDVGGETGASIKPTAASIGSTMRVRVVATNLSGSSAPVISTASAAIITAAPVNQAAPTISGTPQQGRTLTAAPGSWSSSPTSYSYRWQRCVLEPPLSCSDINGATASTYGVDAADITYQLAVRVIATNAGGDSEPADSLPTEHVIPALPVNQSPPTFAGTPDEGQLLTAVPGTWSNDPTSYAYQWFTCDASATSCPDIAGATTRTYVVRSADIGRYVGIEVIARNAGGDSEPAISDAFGPVFPAPPVSRTPPTISGSAQDGQTLTAAPGTWTGSPTGYSYQWYRCDDELDACDAIAPATAATYRVDAADAGSRLAVGVIASNAGGDSDEEFSLATDLVPPSPAAAVVAEPTLPAIAPAFPSPPADMRPTPDNTLAALKIRIRPDGSLALDARVGDPGKLTAVATASTASLTATRCRKPCPKATRTVYGRGSAAATKRGAVLLVITPRTRARKALARNRAITVRVDVTFQSALGGPPTKQHRSLLVRRQRHRQALRAVPTNTARR